MRVGVGDERVLGRKAMQKLLEGLEASAEDWLGEGHTGPLISRMPGLGVDVDPLDSHRANTGRGRGRCQPVQFLRFADEETEAQRREETSQGQPARQSWENLGLRAPECKPDGRVGRWFWGALC